MGSCPICLSALATPKYGRKPTYCSGTCRAKASRERNPAYPEEHRERSRAAYAPSCHVSFLTCRLCGSLFAAKSPRATRCYSEECRKRANSLRMRPIVARRRALKSGAGAERFDPQEIFERDGWVCGICGLDVDPAARFPDPGSASLDHIIPLTRGGAHVRTNVQLAHLYCNCCKGNRTAA